MKSLGGAATDLLWLSPCAESLVALARSPLSSSWPKLRSDPGVALLAARAWGADSIHTRACDVRALRVALHHLRLAAGAGSVDWSRPGCRELHVSSIRQAHLAE